MKRVLVALKDDADAEAAIEALHANGHWPVSRARCYQSALNAVDGNHIDVAVVDHTLTDGSTGIDVVRALKMNFNIDVILIAEDKNANQTIMDIGHRFVQKPVDADLLAAIVGPAPIAIAA